MMPAPNPATEPVRPTGPGWPYLVLTVLLAAIGSDWAAEDVRGLGYVLVALVAVAYAAARDRGV